MANGKSSRSRTVFWGLVLALAPLLMAGCAQDVELRYEPPAPGNTVSGPTAESALSKTALAGQDLFDNNCLRCHGENASGTNQGPPLVHIYYEPGHHSDASIRNAVRNGVPAHHWRFGDMPPVPEVSADELEKIICYLREAQRAEGIFKGNAHSTVC